MTGASTHDASWMGTDGILLHIGQPKSGTTALQSCLDASRPELEAHGVLYPDVVAKRNPYTPNHVPAANAPLDWVQSPARRATSIEMWDELVDETRSHAGRVIVSAENLTVANAETAGRIVSELGADRTRVMITTRPLDRLLPSFWQNEIRFGLRTPYGDWLRLMMQGPDAGDPPATFWVLYDLAAVVARWVGIVGVDRVAVVVVDSDRPTGIYTDVEQLVGLPAGTLDPARSKISNRSLSGPEAELIRRLNCRMPGDVSERAGGTYGPESVGEAAIRHLLAMRRPSPGEPQRTFPNEFVDTLRALSADFVERVRAMGPLVVGDLDSLIPAAGAVDAPPDGPTDLDGDLEIPIDVVVLLVERLMRDAPRRNARAVG